MLKLTKIFLLLLVSANFAQSPLLTLMADDVNLSKYAIAVSGTEYAIKTSPSDINLNQQKFTILAWVKTPSSLSGYHMFLNTHFNAGSPGWWVGLTYDELQFATNWGTGVGVTTQTFNFAADTWYFIAIICTTTTQGAKDYLVYIDNNKIVTSSTAGEVVSNTNPLIVGGYWDNGFALNWTSQIGDIQIIKGHNLSESEIATVMLSGFSASYSAGTVVAWYKWSGTTDAIMLQDYSASGNNLTGNNLTQADDQVIYPLGVYE